MFKNSSYSPQLLEVWETQAFTWKIYEPFSPYSKNLNYNKKLAEINNND